MKIKAIAATTTEPSDDAFTEEQLQQLAATAQNVPILLGFDPDKPVGHVESARVVGGVLEIKGVVNQEFSNMFVVPGFHRDSMSRGAKCTFVSTGITSSPVDKSLTPLRVID